MTFSEYCAYFERVLNTPAELQTAPYDNPDYFNYTKLNWARMHRWLKTGQINDDLKRRITSLKGPQEWIVITEPWCGDAAHSVPFIEMIAALHPGITVKYELRDAEPFRIQQYLTNGGKSIPKLIIRNSAGEDLATWGPRPAECQKLYQYLTDQKANFETTKVELQNWYNKNKGKDLQEEFLQLLEAM